MRYLVVQSERYRAVYAVEAESPEEAQRMVEDGEVEDEAVTLDCVGTDVIEVMEADRD